MGRRRVYKKSSRKERFTVYLGKRDFCEHDNDIDSIDGVVCIDDDKAREQPLFISLCAFYDVGPATMDMVGASKLKNLLYSMPQRLYPEQENPVYHPTRMQTKLLDKLGEGNCFPFRIQPPRGVPPSVTIFPTADDKAINAKNRLTGVHWELIVYSAEDQEDHPSHWRDKLHLGIRKLNILPNLNSTDKPVEKLRKHFALSSGELLIKAELSKPVFEADEPIVVRLHLRNGTKKTVKGVDVRVRQFATLLNGTSEILTSKCIVADEQETEGCPLHPKGVTHERFELYPHKHIAQVALDGGERKSHFTHLASSTLLSEDSDPEILAHMGVKISYDVKIKINVGIGNTVVVKLPLLISAPDENSDSKRRESMLPAERRISKSKERRRSKTKKGGEEEAEDSDGLEVVFEKFIEMRAEAFFSHNADEDSEMEIKSDLDDDED